MSVPVWLYLTVGWWRENRYCVCSLSIMSCQCRCGFTWQRDAGVRTDIVFVLCPLCHVSVGVALPDSRLMAWEQILCLFSVHCAMSVPVWLCLTAGCWHENRYCVCSLSIMPCQCRCGFAWQQDAGVGTDIVFVLCPLCHVSAGVALPDSSMLAWEQILCLFSVHYFMSVSVWLYLTAGCWYENWYRVWPLSIMSVPVWLCLSAGCWRGNRYCVCSLSIMSCQCLCGFTWQQDAGVWTDIVFVLCPFCHVSVGVALPDSRMLTWEQLLCLFSVHYAMSVPVWLCLTAGFWHENRYCVWPLSIMSVPVWLCLTAGCWHENRYCVCSLSIMPCQCRCGFTWQQDAGVRTDIVFVLCPLCQCQCGFTWQQDAGMRTNFVFLLCPLCHVSVGVALPDSRMLVWEQIMCLFSVHYAMSVSVWLYLTAGCWYENR